MDVFQAFDALRAEAEIFEVKHRIRLHAEKSHSKLNLVLSRMAYRGRVPLSSDPAEQFEAYLNIKSQEVLRVDGELE
jgi:hypothetical protein